MIWNFFQKLFSRDWENTTSRKSLLNPKEWRNVLYDPATTSEENFRSSKGIDLKKKRTKNNN